MPSSFQCHPNKISHFIKKKQENLLFLLLKFKNACCLCTCLFSFFSFSVYESGSRCLRKTSSKKKEWKLNISLLLSTSAAAKMTIQFDCWVVLSWKKQFERDCLIDNTKQNSLIQDWKWRALLFEKVLFKPHFNRATFHVSTHILLLLQLLLLILLFLFWLFSSKLAF